MERIKDKGKGIMEERGQRENVLIFSALIPYPFPFIPFSISPFPLFFLRQPIQRCRIVMQQKPR